MSSYTGLMDVSHLEDNFGGFGLGDIYAETMEQYAKAVEFFDRLPQQTLVIWENGPRVTAILEHLREQGLDLLRFKGKGRAVWLGLGVASLQAEAIALHDADILTAVQQDTIEAKALLLSLPHPVQTLQLT